MTFATWISYILNIPAKIKVPIGASGVPGEVWHVTFELNDAEQAAYKSSSPQVLETQSVTNLLWKQIAPSRDVILQASLPSKKELLE